MAKVSLIKRAKFSCSACGRRFAALQIFDAHQDWSQGILQCCNPGDLWNVKGLPRFIMRHGVWHRMDGSHDFAVLSEKANLNSTAGQYAADYRGVSESHYEVAEGSS